jgi:hypothetical protein
LSIPRQESTETIFELRYEVQVAATGAESLNFFFSKLWVIHETATAAMAAAVPMIAIMIVASLVRSLIRLPIGSGIDLFLMIQLNMNDDLTCVSSFPCCFESFYCIRYIPAILPNVSEFPLFQQS